MNHPTEADYDRLEMLGVWNYSFKLSETGDLLWDHELERPPHLHELWNNYRACERAMRQVRQARLFLDCIESLRCRLVFFEDGEAALEGDVSEELADSFGQLYHPMMYFIRSRETWGTDDD